MGKTPRRDLATAGFEADIWRLSQLTEGIVTLTGASNQSDHVLHVMDQLGGVPHVRRDEVSIKSGEKRIQCSHSGGRPVSPHDLTVAV